MKLTSPTDRFKIIYERLLEDLGSVKITNSGLLSNGGVAPLMLFAYDQNANNRDHSLRIHNFLENINAAFQNHNHYNFGLGLAGFGWLLNHLRLIKFIEIDSDSLLLDIDKIVMSQTHSDLINGNHDFIYGGSGGIFYLLSRIHNSKENYKACCDFTVALSSTYDQAGSGIYWKDSHGEYCKNNKEDVNLGLAHGHANKICILAMLLEKGIMKELTREMLLRSIDFLQNTKLEKNADSNYPSHFNSEIESLPSRLAWCYGDLGIANALWYSGNVLSDSSIKIQSENIYSSTLDRRSFDSTCIEDGNICHGTSGLALLYNRIFLNTDDLRYQTQCQYWLERTADYSAFKDGLGGFKTKFPEEFGGWKIDSGLLNGAAGIAMTLLTCQKKILSNWDQSLLIMSTT